MLYLNAVLLEAASLILPNNDLTFSSVYNYIRKQDRVGQFYPQKARLSVVFTILDSFCHVFEYSLPTYTLDCVNALVSSSFPK